MLNNKLAYMIGIFQSDGYYTVFNDKKRNKVQCRFGVDCKIGSLPMLLEFQKIFNESFNRKVSIQKNKVGVFSFRTTINSLLLLFKELEILPKRYSAPTWIQNVELFGAYLAGLIDGDGSVCIKRPKYPQCRIRITDEFSQEYLRSFIRKMFGCSVNITPVKKTATLNGKKIYGEAFDLDFYVSKKNIQIIKRCVYPFIQIGHKKDTIGRFLGLKKGSLNPRDPT